MTGGVVNMSVVYGIATVLALLLAIGYCALVRKKNLWMMLLFISVLIVDLGYFSLAVSKNLSEALLANRISYLGSVFLPLCMLMVIMGVCRINYRKVLVGVLLCVSIVVFVLAASPGYLDCYYKEVSLVVVNGMSRLDKVYGPLHFVYLVYLLMYFGLMIGAILTSIVKKKTVSHKHAALLLIIVFLNIIIWFIEQLVHWDFELLSISYIVSELLLLMLYGMLQDYGIFPDMGVMSVLETDDSSNAVVREAVSVEVLLPEDRVEKIMSSWADVALLTNREMDVLRALLADKKRRDIAEELNVTEHTIKKHTANIFSKFGVTNRAELFEKAEKEVFG